MIDFNNWIRDPVEETELFQTVAPVAEIKAKTLVLQFIQKWKDSGLIYQIKTNYGYDRVCFEMKKILYQDYGILWKTPFELNPELYVLFREQEENGYVWYEERE